MQQARSGQVRALGKLVNLAQVPPVSPYLRPERAVVNGDRVTSYAYPPGQRTPSGAATGLLEKFLKLGSAQRRVERQLERFITTHGALRFPWTRNELSHDGGLSQRVRDYQELSDALLVGLKLRLVGLPVPGVRSGDGTRVVSVSPSELGSLCEFLRCRFGGRVSEFLRSPAARLIMAGGDLPEMADAPALWGELRLKWPAFLYNVMASLPRSSDERVAAELVSTPAGVYALVWSGNPWSALCTSYRCVLEREHQLALCSFCGRELRYARAPRHGARYRACRRKECQRARSRVSMRESRSGK